MSLLNFWDLLVHLFPFLSNLKFLTLMAKDFGQYFLKNSLILNIDSIFWLYIFPSLQSFDFSSPWAISLNFPGSTLGKFVTFSQHSSRFGQLSKSHCMWIFYPFSCRFYPNWTGTSSWILNQFRSVSLHCQQDDSYCKRCESISWMTNFSPFRPYLSLTGSQKSHLW